jgi:hypothetical protein
LRKYPIPSDIAVAIAAGELRKKSSAGPQPEFMQDFGAVWGEEAAGNLSNELSTSPTNDYQRAMDRMHLMAIKPVADKPT